MEDRDFIPIDQAMSELEVARSTWYYYKKQLGFKHRKFKLDPKVYISKEDFARLEATVEAARTQLHRKIENEDPESINKLIQAVYNVPEDSRNEIIREVIMQLEEREFERMIDPDLPTHMEEALAKYLQRSRERDPVGTAKLEASLEKAKAARDERENLHEVLLEVAWMIEKTRAAEKAE